MITVTTAKKIPHESERHRDSSCPYRDCSGARPKRRHGRDERFHQRPKQRGIVIPLVAIAMLALLAMAGLALDMGHLYENKTRLQNVVDAAALAAAQKLGETPGDQAAKEAAATTAAEDTIVVHNKGKTGNAELGSVLRSDVAVTFFNLVPGVCAGVGFDPCFVRVVVNNLSRPNFFAQVLTAIGATKTVAARAASGPIAIEPCNIFPVTVCAKPAVAGGPIDMDDDTDDGLFFGYPINGAACLKSPNSGGQPSPECAALGPGNFHLLDLDESHGGDDVCVHLAGAYEGCRGVGENLDLAQGYKNGPVQNGVNTRFNEYPPGSSCGGGIITRQTAPPDTVVSYGPGAPGETHTSWLSAPTEVADGKKGRRVVGVPIANCPTPCSGNSCTPPVLDFGCFFLRNKMNNGKPGELIGEFVGTGCLEKGTRTGGGLAGPYKMVLYKDATSGDS
ncbi:MAG: pilus assembly protein TadG-related protein [Gammaproteobacteria bacterium]